MVRRGGGGGDNDADLALVGRALEGDKRAWEGLVHRLTPAAQGRVAKVLLRKRPANRKPTRQDVLDHVQDVFVLLLENDYRVLRSWHPDRGASLTTFVGFVAERLTLSALRTGKLGAWLEDPTDDGSIDHQIEAGGPSPENLAIDRATLDRLLDRLGEILSPYRMEMFLALYRDDRPTEEVAQEMGTTPNGIATWRSRLRQVLQRLLEEMGEPAQ